jgi:hypothetical protein
MVEAMSGADDDDLVEQVSKDEVAFRPSDAADPRPLLEAKIPADLLERYEIHSYRSAAVILSEGHPTEFTELCEALRALKITRLMIRTAGGNESDIPKALSTELRPLGWNETVIQGDLVVRLTSKVLVPSPRSNRIKSQTQVREVRRDKYLDGHKIDYVKGRVAFDLEWNSKDQTFDRDLYAFSAFAQCGIVDVGVLVTRGMAMTDFIAGLGPALTKKGTVELDRNGNERPTSAKYGASTTWMGKLLYRLNAGRNGACPVLVVGITPACVVD